MGEIKANTSFIWCVVHNVMLQFLYQSGTKEINETEHYLNCTRCKQR